MGLKQFSKYEYDLMLIVLNAVARSSYIVDWFLQNQDKGFGYLHALENDIKTQRGLTAAQVHMLYEFTQFCVKLAREAGAHFDDEHARCGFNRLLKLEKILGERLW